MAIQSINPATGSLVKTFEAHNQTYVAKALFQASEVFDQWRSTPMPQRSELMNNLGSVLATNQSYYAGLVSEEMGKVKHEAEGEIAKCARLCHYFAEQAEAFLRPEPIETEAKSTYLRFDPLGTVLAVMPWNFPFWQVFRFAVPATMAGNTALLKHASNVPRCAEAIEQAFLKAGFPQGLFQNLFVDSEQVTELIAHPTVKAVTLTGSEGAGRAVAAEAARHLKKQVLELGGSDPFIVLEDADLEKAARTAVASRMINSGQSCIAAKRFIVVEALADQFAEAMAEQMAALQMGLPEEEGSDYGPMARLDLADELDDQLRRSLEMGAELLTGGNREPGSPYFPATVLDRVTPEMPAGQEELFGPVAAIMRAQDEKEAIRLANASPYGLGASLWTGDPDKAQCYAAEIEAGCVFVNQLVKSDQRVPFGGIKNSGYGRELAWLGIREFTNQKSVWIEQ